VTSPPLSDERAVDEALKQLIDRFPVPRKSDRVEVLGAQYDLGLAWVHFGQGFGGLNVAAGLQPHVDEVLRVRGFPPSSGDFIALHQCANVINAVGTVVQKRRFLRPIFTGTAHWCQLFSEPGAGSDLAGLSTTAIRDGDEWLVNGQKVWTSGAAEARWAILLARTDPAAPKHQGLTFFVCDMRATGVLVRPLRQADGGTHFNEVFLTDVRLPDDMRLGDIGQGWGISITALHSERDGTGDFFARPIAEVVALWHDRVDRSSPHALVLRDQLVRLWIESRVVEMSNLRMRAALKGGGSTPLGSLAKIASSEHAQRLAQLATTLMGPAGQVGLHYDDALRDREFNSLSSMSAQRFAIRSRAMTIEGGTNEILRNVIGERVLGLAGEPRTDKTLPWREVLRS
jgi:alkylation response protein AidB-like acyl-CoA dehydrogenase